MRNFQTKSKSKFKFALMAGLATCVGMSAAHDAEAAYSGSITRSVCMAGAMVPRNPDRNFWDNTANTTCSAKVIDAGSATAFHWARVSIPVERKTTTATIAPTVRVNAGGPGNGQVCAQLWLSGPAGNLSTGANDCSVDGFGFETLTPAALTLPIDGAVTIDIAAQNRGEAHVVALSWTANGI
jgi:hypothetical protein